METLVYKITKMIRDDPGDLANVPMAVVTAAVTRTLEELVESIPDDVLLSDLLEEWVMCEGCEKLVLMEENVGYECDMCYECAERLAASGSN